MSCPNNHCEEETEREEREREEKRQVKHTVGTRLQKKASLLLNIYMIKFRDNSYNKKSFIDEKRLQFFNQYLKIKSLAYKLSTRFIRIFI